MDPQPPVLFLQHHQILRLRDARPPAHLLCVLSDDHPPALEPDALGVPPTCGKNQSSYGNLLGGSHLSIHALLWPLNNLRIKPIALIWGPSASSSFWPIMGSGKSLQKGVRLRGSSKSYWRSTGRGLRQEIACVVGAGATGTPIVDLHAGSRRGSSQFFQVLRLVKPDPPGSSSPWLKGDQLRARIKSGTILLDFVI